MSNVYTHAQGVLLAQVRPLVDTPILLYKNGELRVEITSIFLGLDLSASTNIDTIIWHDDSGADVYNNSTQLFVFRRSVDDNKPLIYQAQHPGSGIHMAPNASLGIEISQADKMTVSIYGVTETLAERVRAVR